MKNPLLCRKVANHETDCDDSRVIEEKERSGEWEVRRYPECFIVFAPVTDRLVLGVLYFERFSRDTVRAMQDATYSRSEQIMAVTKDKRVARVMERIGYHRVAEKDGSIEMRTWHV